MRLWDYAVMKFGTKIPICLYYYCCAVTSFWKLTCQANVTHYPMCGVFTIWIVWNQAVACNILWVIVIANSYTVLVPCLPSVMPSRWKQPLQLFTMYLSDPVLITVENPINTILPAQPNKLPGSTLQPQSHATEEFLGRDLDFILCERTPAQMRISQIYFIQLSMMQIWRENARRTKIQRVHATCLFSSGLCLLTFTVWIGFSELLKLEILHSSWL